MQSNYHKLGVGALKPTEIYSLTFQKAKSQKSRCPRAELSLETPKEVPFLPLLASGRLQVPLFLWSASNPWPLCLHRVLARVCKSVSAFLTHVTCSEPTGLVHNNLSISRPQITFSKTLFPYRICRFQGLRIFFFLFLNKFYRGRLDLQCHDSFRHTANICSF